MILDARLKGVWMPVTLRIFPETGGILPPVGGNSWSHGGFNEKIMGKISENGGFK